MGLDQLKEALGQTVLALRVCRAEGLQPAEALAAVGIQFPGFVQPMLNGQLNEVLDAAEETSTEGLQS